MNNEDTEVNERAKRYLEPDPDIKYVAVRLIECFCIAMFIFGFMWNTTEMLKLTTPQFMMLYGGGGAVVSEVLARLFSKKKQNLEK